MTQPQIELHERFIKGVTGKMIGWGIGFVFFMATSFWGGVYSIKSSISDLVSRRKQDKLSNKISLDSIQHINEITHIKMWDAIKEKRSGFLTETRDKSGKITVHNDN